MSKHVNAQSKIAQFQQWHDDYRASLTPSPLEDISQLAAELDMTNAHPSGIARLFAAGRVTMESLFRDNGVLRAAERRLGRVLDDQNTRKRCSGVAELSLVVGVATWKGNALPVLLYPVEVTHSDHLGRSSLRFTGRAKLNAALVSRLQAAGVDCDEEKLFDASSYESGAPETSAVFGVISDQVSNTIADFTIDRRVILGCFMEPSALILAETQRIIDRLGKGATGQLLLDALAGDKSSRTALNKGTIAEYSPFDADPHSEYEVGDVDNTVRYAAQLAASGRSITIDSAVSNDTAEQAAAIASRCVMSGRSVLYVPGVGEQKRRFMQVSQNSEISSLVLDVADEKASAAIDQQLIAAVGFQAGAASEHFDQIADELVGVRSRLTRYLGDLHGVNEKWGVCAYQTIQNLASIASTPAHPATRVRLSEAIARQLAGHLDDWTAKLERAGELGEYTIGPDDTAWYKASLTSEQEAVSAYRRVVDLLQKVLPTVREHVATTVQTCGFPVPASAHEWNRQITVLKNLRRVLDVFQPEIFERDIDSMIEASKPKSARKAEGSALGFWERRRHVREAKSLLRVGAQVTNLHDALVVVKKQSEQWRTLVPHGGWPVLPAHLDQMIATQETMSSDITSLNTVLSTTEQGGELETLDFNEVERRLKALFDDHKSLDTLPERCCLERELQEAGLHDLVADLTNRQVSNEAVGAELQLAWWTTVFEDIVRSSPIISNQDGSALSAATERFEQVDIEHVRSVGPMVAQESMRRLCDMLFSRTQEANLLHTQLAGRSRATLDAVRHDHPEIFAATKPILVAMPDTLAALTEPKILADVAIVDACAHMPAVQMLSILSRVKQIVVIAHCNTVTCPGLKQLIDMLPQVKTKTHPVCSSPTLAKFLESQGYGSVSYDVPSETAAGHVAYHYLNANGTPVFSTGLVESSTQEIEEVIRLITERASSFTIVPADYVLTVITLTDVFRTRLGAELKALASKNKTMGSFLRHVRLIGIREVAGVETTDAIVSLCYAKTSHGRLLQQFGALEEAGGRGMLLDALALTNRHLDIVSAFSSEDMQDDRIHQAGVKLLKTMLMWAEQLDGKTARPAVITQGSNTLLNDLADRIRGRGLNVALDYGFDKGHTIPMVVGLNDKPFALAVLTDDADYMSIQSTRERHRMLTEGLKSLGWSVATVWSVGAFVNPEKEVDRLVAMLGDIYKEVK